MGSVINGAGTGVGTGGGGGGGGGGLPKTYRPSEHESRIAAKWDAARAFHAHPEKVLKGEKKPYCLFIPPPNVTAALHLGHALNNTLQDILARAHRMKGFETLWMPGTDHAGIATQAVVEKRVLKEEGKRRKDFTREEFVAKIQAFKDEYEATITAQLKEMGCSCDWDRQRFTMDEQCAAAVREAFFRLFKDGLIYRGKRLVNWDPALQTAVADDECYDQEIDGAFYYLRYPLVRHEPGKGSPNERAADKWHPVTWNELATRGYPGASDHPGEQQAWVTVATTRPETYLGDTAVGMNPHDPRLKALHGLRVELPLVGRVLPIIADDYVVLSAAMWKDPEEAKNDPKAQYATGFLKVTPAHDGNDYELYQRHKAAIDANSSGTGLINIMAPDGSISDKHGWSDVGDAHLFVGLSREEARKKVVAEFKARGLLEGTRPYRHSVKHSERSKAIVEPYLSDQWYVKVTDERMAAAANRALVGEQRAGLTIGGNGLGGCGLGGTGLQTGVGGGSRRSHASLSANDIERLAPSLNYEVLRSAGFTAKDPYPPGEPSPDFLHRIRNLPHIELDGATYYVTWRTREGTLTAHEQTLVLETLRYWNGQGITLFAATVMPDHVHAIVKPSSLGLGEWVASVKKFSARAVNQSRRSDGALWQDERFDHIVRDGRWFGAFLRYLIRNPVEDGLAEETAAYEGTWLNEAVLKSLGIATAADAADTGLETGATKGRTQEGDATLSFHPERYAKTYEQWHDNIRDWCISRQLWWGHRIPVWQLDGLAGEPEAMDQFLADLKRWRSEGRIATSARASSIVPPAEQHMSSDYPDTFVCVRSSADMEVISTLEKWRFVQDPDVLDTWFSSALWPLSTLGWPDPAAFNKASNAGLLDAFNPSSVLCTAREIITLWVSRMVMMNRYFLGEGQGRGPAPFKDVFIHAMIQDGEGRKMSKSLGNGVDPRDIIATHGADAMRFTLCHMTTQTQDVRMPVEPDPATGKNTSPKFDIGRNYCNKLWNTTRFVMEKLGRSDEATKRRSEEGVVKRSDLGLLDRWMLSRLARTVKAADGALERYEFSDYAEALYRVLWWDLCDWYLEGVKPTVEQSPAQRAVLGLALRTIVRLLHPVTPFITEAIWEHLRDLPTGAIEGLADGCGDHDLLCLSAWPTLGEAWIDEDAEREFERVRELISAVRNLRSEHQVPPKRRVTLHVPPAWGGAGGEGRSLLAVSAGLIESLAGVEKVELQPAASSPAVVTFRALGQEMQLSNLADAIDAGAERERLTRLIADLEKTAGTMEKRLSNEGYIAKAPPKLVEESKAQLAKVQAELTAARQRLSEI